MSLNILTLILALLTSSSIQAPPPVIEESSSSLPLHLTRNPQSLKLHPDDPDGPEPIVKCMNGPIFRTQLPLDVATCVALSTRYDQQYQRDTILTHDPATALQDDDIVVPYRSQQGVYGLKVDYFGGPVVVPDLDQGYVSWIGQQICNRCAKNKGGKRYGARVRVYAKDASGKEYILKIRIIKYNPGEDGLDGAYGPDDGEKEEEEAFADVKAALNAQELAALDPATS